MKWLGRLSTIALAVIAFKSYRHLIDNYEVFVMNKEDAEEMAEEIAEMNRTTIDLRGTPTHVCVCGCDVFNIRATFKNSEIASYLLDMECAYCGNLATAPTPIDQIPGTDEI